MGSGFRCQAARPKVSSMPRYRRVITWVRSWMRGLTLVPLIPVMGCCAVEGQAWDVASDTWAATDGLGRKVALFPEVSKPRADRTVGMFYFLWHGAHIQGGPFDVTRILASDPIAMQKPDSPLWGPLHAPHHWGESLFGYYLTADEGVLRKHAQMLGDAGVDVVIFDVTNQVTYRDDYRALLKVWSEMRRLGNRTPQVAFLTPFWDPAKVTRELWRDLYSTGWAEDLWFRWYGKPLILADSELLFEGEENKAQNTPAELQPGHTLGQTFSTRRTLLSVGGRFPTWGTRGSAVTLTLFRDRPGGERIIAQRFHDVADNGWLRLSLDPPLPPGNYYLEASEPGERVGWWSHTSDVSPAGEALADALPAGGDRTLRLQFADGDTREILDFFTFRKPQPDYFQGPTKANMWSWLEVYPQHVFTNVAGQKEQMSVGVGQNAVNGRLGSMSEPGSRGRSFHAGSVDVRPGSVRQGFNVAEQWARALKEDPQFVFITGWNEWIAGRFAEFNRVRLPVMFVDQYDQEHSRDIEPMRGGHGDDYYYQLVSHVRRYKGARPLPELGSRPIRVDGRFEDWAAVSPEYRDTAGDPVRRDHRGWDPKVTYRNETGKNDIIVAKTSWDSTTAWFYVRTRQPLTASGGTNWMLLFLDVDTTPATGWLGYDFVMGRAGTGSLERSTGSDFHWTEAGTLEVRTEGNELEVAIPWKSLGLTGPPLTLDFKWADNCIQSGDWTDLTLNGDTAPNDRFNYRATRHSE
jgi:hypothetical protein